MAWWYVHPYSFHVVARGIYLNYKSDFPLWKFIGFPVPGRQGLSSLAHVTMAPIYIPSFISLPSCSRTIRLLEGHWILHTVSHCHIWLYETPFPPLFTGLTIIFSSKISSNMIFSRKPFQTHKLKLPPIHIFCTY